MMASSLGTRLSNKNDISGCPLGEIGQTSNRCCLEGLLFRACTSSPILEWPLLATAVEVHGVSWLIRRLSSKRLEWLTYLSKVEWLSLFDMLPKCQTRGWVASLLLTTTLSTMLSNVRPSANTQYNEKAASSSMNLQLSHLGRS